MTNTSFLRANTMKTAVRQSEKGLLVSWAYSTDETQSRPKDISTEDSRVGQNRVRDSIELKTEGFVKPLDFKALRRVF